MKKEYLDVVNAKNKIISKALRSDCHKKGLWHRTSHIIVINYQGDVFVQKRAPDKDLSPNLWAGVAEHLISGESYLTAAIRGVGEELQIRENKDALERIRNFKNFYNWGIQKKNRELVDLFILRNSGSFKIDKKEATKNAFLKVEKILSLRNKHILAKGIQLNIKYYLEYRKKQSSLFCEFKKSKDSLWVLWENKVIYRSGKKGIEPLIELIKKNRPILKYHIVFDKIVGRAASLLLVYAGVGEVHTEIISHEAIKILKKYKIYHQYGKTVARILNRDKSDSCPFEKMAQEKTPAQFYKMIKNKF